MNNLKEQTDNYINSNPELRKRLRKEKIDLNKITSIMIERNPGLSVYYIYTIQTDKNTYVFSNIEQY